MACAVVHSHETGRKTQRKNIRHLVNVGSDSCKRRVVLNVTNDGYTGLQPVGCKWSNNSCTYNSMVFIMFNLWNSDRPRHGGAFEHSDNIWMRTLGTSFSKFVNREYMLEAVRDYFRRGLQREFPDTFVFGRFVSVEAVMFKLMMGNDIFETVLHKCPNGHERSMAMCWNLRPRGHCDGLHFRVTLMTAMLFHLCSRVQSALYARLTLYGNTSSITLPRCLLCALHSLIPARHLI